MDQDKALSRREIPRSFYDRQGDRLEGKCLETIRLDRGFSDDVFRLQWSRNETFVPKESG
jgi:hypothetical protein